MTEAADAEPCDVCGAPGRFEHVVTISLCGVFDAAIARCPRCGFRQIRPRLNADELRALYPEAYFDPTQAIGYSAYAREQQRAEREAWHLASIVRRLGRCPRVLEVGCALGFTLDALRRFAPCEVKGVDVSDFAACFAERAFGLSVRAGTLEEAGFPDASFDLILQKDLLEHVLRPRDHLAETFRVLAPGGLVWLVTPNGETNVRPLARRAREEQAAGTGMLPMIDQGHLSFFGRAHLARLFRDTGFEILSMRTIHLKRGLRALGHLPRRRSREKLAVGGRPRGQTRASAAPASPDDALLDRLAESIRGAHRAHRSASWYYGARGAMRSLGALPGALDLGLDFECWLRKPG
ncbi:MAG TPA: class I SAM-dependent methyltransferase [Candidatus Eisenbacteria bacterium]|nr:class I SAM-dependent methyltransferase [Candidatus Eisenbacteria bacterium]